MKARTALKIYRTIQKYKDCNRPDMPYTGAQVARASIRILPPPLRRFYRGWHKVTKEEGRRELLALMKGGPL